MHRSYTKTYISFYQKTQNIYGKRIKRTAAYEREG